MAGIVLAAQATPAQETDYRRQQKEIAEQLVCLCGCGNQILSTCVCGEAKQDKAFILKQLKAGKSRQQILDMMVDRYGERVLAAPKREGINWFVWVVVPYIVPIFGAIGIGFLIIRWVRRRQISSPQPPAASTEGEISPPVDKYKQKLEEELKDFE
jgi:cytochrome c-type biogenesis protein CcmH